MKALVAALAALCLAGSAGARAPQRTGEGKPPDALQMEKRMRELRVVGIAEALDLDTAEALRLDALMRPFDERRRPLQRQVHDAMKVLKQAADGDEKALPQVDDATMRILDARAQIAQVDREMFNAIAQGRSAQQKAKLALFLAHFQEEARKLHQMMKAGGGGHPPPGE